jgi:hypothetical protein
MNKDATGRKYWGKTVEMQNIAGTDSPQRTPEKIFRSRGSDRFLNQKKTGGT